MNKFGKRLIAAGVCAGLSAVMLTGCSSLNKKDTLVTLGDAKLTVGEVAFWLRYSQANMEQSLGGLFGDGNMWEQDLFGTGTPYGDTMKAQVLSDLEEMVLMEQHAGDYNVELTAEEEAAIDTATQEFLAANSADTLKAMYADEETVSRVLRLNAIHNKVHAAIEEGADTNVTDEEAAQKTIEYATFSTAATTDDDGNTVELTDEEKAAVEQQAKDVIEAVKGGKTLEEAVKEIDEDQTTHTNSYGEDDSTMVAALKEAADTLSDGEIYDTPVEYDNGWYVVQMVSTFDEEATQERKEEIIQERKDDLVEETLEGWQPDNTEVDTDLWEKITFNIGFNAPETESESDADTEALSEAESAADEETTEAESAADETETESAAEETETESAAEETETESTADETQAETETTEAES